MPLDRTRWKAVTTVAVAIACTVSASGTPAGATTPAEPSTAAGSTVPSSPSGPSWTVTLITGDVVKLSGKPGHQSFRVVKDVPPVGDVSAMQLDGDLYAVPGAAIPMIAANQLDRRLFDLSLLARDGLADAQDTTLPLIVSYKSRTATLRRDATAGSATVTREIPALRGAAVEVPTAKAAGFLAAMTDRTSERAATLVAKPDVAKIWLDGRVRADLDESRKLVGADRAAEAGFDGTGITVGVLDTGIDETHPDLAGVVTEKQSFVEGGDPLDVTDRVGHGTHVSSIIAGRGTASNGLYTGVASGARLIVGKVLGDNGSGSESQVIAGMEWIARKTKVINMSLGAGPSDGTDPMSQALNRISAETGALFVTSAGNAGDPQTVGTPAAADAALAVGATQKGRDGTNPTTFSSKGPRLGDFTIKPEISAPGETIRAAQAAGTELGNEPPGAPYADYYTNASGTSMAAPHVTAAAAIVSQQHPDWSARQLKDTLTSTARTAPADDPLQSMVVWHYGAGTVDAGRAVTQKVHGTGILDLGTKPYPQQPGDTLSGTVTYSNTGDTPVTLDLTSRWWTAPRNFGSVNTRYGDWHPPAGAVTVTPSTVTVPAGGTATTTVTVDAGLAPQWATYGRLTAKSADGTAVGTAMSFVRDVERYRLSLPATDLDGSPVSTSGSLSYGYLQDIELGTVYVVTWDQGRSVVHGVTGGLPKGRYSFIGWINTYGEAPWYPLRTSTSIAEPEIVNDHDQEYAFDARQAGPLDLRTERPSTQFEDYDLLARTSPAGYFGVGFAPAPWVGIRLLASRTSASTGTFRYDHSSLRVAPPVTLTAAGQETQARYPFALERTPCPDSALLPDCLPRFPERAGGSLVDVGRATQAEIAAAAKRWGGLAGRFVMLRPSADDIYGGEVRGVGAAVAIDDMAARLGAARVAGIVFVPPADGVQPQYLEKVAGPPVAWVPVADGRRLVAASRGGQRAVGFSLRGAYPSPYKYNLGVSAQGRLPAGIRYRPRDEDLARIDTRYHGDTPGERYGVATLSKAAQFGSAGRYELVPAGLTRPEFYTPGYPWLATDQFIADRLLQHDLRWSMSLRPGQRERHDVGAGPWAPGEYRGLLDPFLGEQFMEAGYEPDAEGYLLRTRLGLFDGPGPWANDELQDARSAFSGRLQCVSGCGYVAFDLVDRMDAVLTGGDAPVYTMVNDTSVGGSDPELAARLPRLSTRTHTEWTVHAELDRTKPVEQPGVLLDWSVDTGLDNVVPRNRHEVTITPGYSSRYTSSHGTFTVQLWATYDDGITWTKAGTQTRIGKDHAATFKVGTPRQSNGYVGYRAVATDATGNQIDQTVIRAARTTPAG